MIDARELRIGNYYKADIEFPKGSISAKVGFGEDRIFQFTEHVAKVVYQSYSTDLDLKMFINPIPLTEDWLLRFGAEKGTKEWLNDYDTEAAFKLTNDFIVKSCGSSYGLCSPFKIYYEDCIVKYTSPHDPYKVHELQNLFRDLTGKELELNTEL